MYARAKGAPDTQSFGTRDSVYAPGYEWALHSLSPTHISAEASRVEVGGPQCALEHRYSAALLNVSGMSYGALSDKCVWRISAARPEAVAPFLLLFVLVQCDPGS